MERIIETEPEEALMEFPYRPEEVEEAGAHFDRVVYCGRQGTIKIWRVLRLPN